MKSREQNENRKENDWEDHRLRYDIGEKLVIRTKATTTTTYEWKKKNTLKEKFDTVSISQPNAVEKVTPTSIFDHILQLQIF